MPNHDNIDKYADANAHYGCFADLKVILDEILEEALNTPRWFYGNSFKYYTDKCFLLTTSRPPANNN